MSSSRTFLDANILLELLLPGRPKTTECEKLISQIKGTAVISILSVHIVYYYCQKQGYSIGDIDGFLTEFEIAGAGASEYKLALELIKGKDLEDAMQVAVALSANCDHFLTIDSSLANNYKDIIKITPV